MLHRLPDTLNTPTFCFLSALKDRIRIKQSKSSHNDNNDSKRSKPRSGTFKRGPDGLFAFELDSDSEDEQIAQKIAQQKQQEIIQEPPKPEVQPELITLSLRIRSATNAVRFGKIKRNLNNSGNK